MVIFKQLTLSAVAATLLLTGCTKNEITPKEEPKNIVEKEKAKVEKYNLIKMSAPTLPTLSLPQVYAEPTFPTSEKEISFSATNAPLSKILYIISKEADMNLVIDNNVDVDQTVTLNLQNAPLKDALEITMDITNSFIEKKGNILHVKKQMTKTFELPFVNMKAQTTSELGGDLLGANDTAGSITGDFSMSYSSDEDNGDFYLQLEESVEALLSEEGTYSINKFSGTLVVTDTKKNVDQIATVVENLKKFLNKQILIEAKIMEVILNDSHQLGVNWQKAWQNINNAGGTLAMGAIHGGTGALSQVAGIAAGNAFNSGIAAPVGGVATSIAYTTANFDAVLQAMESAGKIEVVSNPRIKVMNGQSGVLSSGNIIPYWEKEVTYTTTGTGATAVTTPEITYEKNDVLNGISLGVSPIIRENGEVVLNVIPVVTTIDGEKTLSDANGEVATAPIINVKEAGTTVLTKDDDMVVIGGLISSVKRDSENKTPFAGDIPVAGNLFKSSTGSFEKRELVIILKIDVDERKN